MLDIQVKQANGSAPRGVRPADERIGLVDLLDEQGPITAALFAISSRLPGPVQREAGLHNPPDASYALADIGVAPVKTHKLLPFVRELGDEGGKPIQSRRTVTPSGEIFGFPLFFWDTQAMVRVERS